MWKNHILDPNVMTSFISGGILTESQYFQCNSSKISSYSRMLNNKDFENPSSLNFNGLYHEFIISMLAPTVTSAFCIILMLRFLDISRWARKTSYRMSSKASSGPKTRKGLKPFSSVKY